MSLEKRVLVQAPSNIALIKYMGKISTPNSTLSSERNVPANPSISMTLNSLCTYVDVSLSAQNGDTPVWISELPRGLPTSQKLQPAVPKLKQADQDRVIQHVLRVRAAAPEILGRFGVEFADSKAFGCTLRTANTFPASSGIASSASSFAAVTLGVMAVCAKDPSAFERAFVSEVELKRCLAEISRQGSGSSCRSFEGPWVGWTTTGSRVQNQTTALEATAMPRMAHFVVLIKTQPKAVSSSEAHARILSSPLWSGRVERVQGRFYDVKNALREGNLSALARSAWIEAWEMHSLFHTANQPFSYWEPGTIEGLHWLAQFMNDAVPPIVTLDAGPNIHIIVPEEQRALWREKLSTHYAGMPVPTVVLEDGQGTGASLLELSK